jgi:hypothetical protein
LAASAAHWRLCWRSCFTAAKPTLTSRARSTYWSSTTYSLDASTPPHHRHAVSHSAAQINTVLQDGVVWAVAALRTAKHPRHPVWRPPSVSSSLTHPAFLVHLHPPLLFLCCTSPFVQGQSRQPRGGWGFWSTRQLSLPIFLFLKCAIGRGKRSTNTPSSGSLNSLTLGSHPD